MRIEGPDKEVKRLLKNIPGMLSVEVLGERENGVFEYDIEGEPNSDLRREIFKRLAAREWAILGMRSSEMTLEDIFLQLTSDEKTA